MYESTDILILAVVAGFIIFKLYSILGQNDEELMSKESNKRKIIDIIPLKTFDKNFAKDQIKDDEPELKPEIKRVIDEIKGIDLGFNIKTFVASASKAFEMILASYSTGDKDSLANLLSKEVHRDFSKEIDARAKNKEILDKTLVSIISSEIVSANLDRKIASISIKFVSQQINLIKNIDGKILKGDPSEIDNISENWTFSRNLSLSNPIWKLVETKTSNA